MKKTEKSPDFSIFPEKLHIGRFQNQISDRDTHIGTNIILGYKVPPPGINLQKKGFNDFFSLDRKDLLGPMFFTKIAQFFHNYDIIRA